MPLRIVVIGPNRGDKLIKQLCDKHEEIYLFEPMPDAAKWLRDNNDDSNIHIIEAACGVNRSVKTMNLYNDGLSSSFGICTQQAIDVYGHKYDLSHRGTLDVEVVNAYEYLTERGICEVETLLTDAQGMDLQILQTFTPFIRDGLIQTIICEADHDEFRHYDGLPSNCVSHFVDFMRQFPSYRMMPYDENAANPNLVWRFRDQ